MDVWVETEVSDSVFPDQRLKSRFSELLSSMGQKIGDTIPTACQDWAATKAAYRFFSNPRVDESCILSGHLSATADRVAQTSGTVLVVHDTTEFTFRRERVEEIGKINVTHNRQGNPVTVCGLLMHSSLVVTADRLP